jgi:hypothetical protein
VSLEIYVFMNKSAIPSADSWGAAVRSAGFNIELDSSFDPLTDNGFVPCRFGSFDTGFEYSLSAKDDVASVYPDVKLVTEQYDSAVSFTWGGDTNECAAAVATAAVLTMLGSGLMYDPHDAVRFGGPEAVEYARRTVAAI